MYEIIFKQGAFDVFKTLHKNIQEEIANKLRRIVVDPKKELLKLRKSPYYYFRISAYRIICNLKDNELIVEVVKIGHRGFIYTDMGI